MRGAKSMNSTRQGDWRQIQARERDRQFEAARAGTARIEIQDAVTFRARRLVRMTAHHDVEARGGGVQIKLL